MNNDLMVVDTNVDVIAGQGRFPSFRGGRHSLVRN